MDFWPKVIADYQRHGKVREVFLVVLELVISEELKHNKSIT
jgi:hypothetical protein